MIMASWNSGGKASKGMLLVNFFQFDFVAVSVGPVPQQCDNAVYSNVFPWVSIRRIGAVTRPTSSSRFGHDEGFFKCERHAICFGLTRQS